MEPTISVYKHVRKVLNGIEVRKQPGCFPEDEREYFCKNSGSYAFELAPEEESLTLEEEDDNLFKLMSISFYGGDGLELNIDQAFYNVHKEIIENLSLPIDRTIIARGIREIISFYSEFESQIVEDDAGLFNSVKVNFIGIKREDLDIKDTQIYSGTLEELKKNLRKEIVYLNIQLSKLTNVSLNSNPQINKAPSGDQFEKINPETKDRLLRSFTWRKENFNQEILLLFTFLKEGIIPQETDFNDFKSIFSGIVIDKPLHIKWLVTGKNKKTSKSSLFHFFSRLEDYKLIENKEWQDNNTRLYEKLSAIFVDNSGNRFSIDGLKSSKCQGLTTNCAMQDELDRIVKAVYDSALKK